MIARRSLGFAGASLIVGVIALTACVRNPFVGPATAAPACAVDCRDGTCCHYGLLCHDFQDSHTCEPDTSDPMGTSRDGGAPHSEPRFSKATGLAVR